MEEPVGPSAWLWKEGMGYYNEREADLLRKPYLPDERFIPDRRIAELFQQHGGLTDRSQVLEIGCGRSPWLPYLAQSVGCRPVGIDLEPYAARLARANLAGSGVEGEVYCRDAFDVHANEALWGRFDLVYSIGVLEHLPAVSEKIGVLNRYLKPGGRLVTIVPNMQGVNWLLQRIGSLRVLQAHVVYTADSLRTVHEEAGLHTRATGYLGFAAGFLSSSLGEPSRARRMLHHGLCRTLAICSAIWIRAGLPMREWPLIAPWIFFVGIRSTSDAEPVGSDERLSDAEAGVSTSLRTSEKLQVS